MKILTICGSPRQGNSETIALAIKKIFAEKGIENDIILLREKNIERCHGCVEFCNHRKICRLNDDMTGIMEEIVAADGYIFIAPNYFQMPPGLFKDFVDRSCIMFSSGMDENIKNKKAAVICVGADPANMTDVCTEIIAKNYCGIIGMNVVFQKSYQTKSELNGHLNDIFESGINPNIQTDLQSLASALV